MSYNVYFFYLFIFFFLCFLFQNFYLIFPFISLRKSTTNRNAQDGPSRTYGLGKFILVSQRKSFQSLSDVVNDKRKKNKTHPNL
jgi:hypothetical protein